MIDPRLFPNEMKPKIGRGDWNYTLETAPASEPVTLSDAKLYARIDTDADDALVTALIAVARKDVESQTGRALITQTWKATLDELPCSTKYELAFRPIASITSIKAYNEDGTDEALTVADDIILDGANARYGLKSTAPAITGDRSFEVYEVVYVCGAATAPEWAQLAIKQIVAYWYEHRGDDSESMKRIPMGAQLLIDQNMVVEL